MKLKRRPRLYTTYFGRLKKIDYSDKLVVAVCRYPPVGWSGIQIESLLPDERHFRYYKDTGDWEGFSAMYRECTLSRINPEWLEEMLFNKSGGRDVVLTCYEKGEECHRHLIAKWLGENHILVEEI